MAEAGHTRLYILAGEASGDMHAANLLHHLKAKQDNLVVRGVGGDLLEAEGMHLTRHIRDTNFMGFVEVVKHLRTIRRLFKAIKADIMGFQPNAILLVDYPGFNLRIAKWAVKAFAGKSVRPKILYYISPQLWAWKAKRVETIRKCVDRMMVILPFEEAWYQERGVKVDYVGHPLLDVIPGTPEEGPSLRQELNIPADKPLVALLPGSRRAELKRILPVMLAVAEQFPEYAFVIAGAATLPESAYTEWQASRKIPVVMGRSYHVLRSADYALVKSGTSTLEAALFRVPEVVGYKADATSYRIARRVVMDRIKYISLVNLVLDKPAVTELIQGQFTPENLASELRRLIHDAVHRKRMLSDYAQLVHKLGDAGASKRAADLVYESLLSSS